MFCSVFFSFYSYSGTHIPKYLKLLAIKFVKKGYEIKVKKYKIKLRNIRLPKSKTETIDFA